MSKLGKKPILIPQNVEVKLEPAPEGGILIMKGKEGELRCRVLPFIIVDVKDGQIRLSASGKGKQARANWGTMAALVRNALEGVSRAYSKTLDIEGIGYRANMEGQTLVLQVGFSHPVKFVAPEGVKIVVEKSAIRVSGIDKAMVGEAAAQIRRIKPPEPYKGTGIRYHDEVIRRKAGKKVAGAGAATAK